MQIMKLAQAIRPHAPKVLIYGDSGIGKTTLIGSLPGKVLIVSAESGLLSLSFASGDDRFDVVEIEAVDDLIAVHKHLTSKTHGYDWVALDSISEIAEVVLTAEKKKVSDPRQAYGAVIERVTAAMRAFRDLPIGVYFSAKLAKVKDDATGRITYGISMPGAKLGDAVPYLFDEVFRLVCVDEVDPDGNRVPVRYLQTSGDARSIAKDRSGALDPLEPADLGAVVAKMAAHAGVAASTTKE
jgi:phage nucleotide-binding protein